MAELRLVVGFGCEALEKDTDTLPLMPARKNVRRIEHHMNILKGQFQKGCRSIIFAELSAA